MVKSQLSSLQLYKEMMHHEYNISNNYPDVRLFLVNINGSETPLADFASVGLPWSKPSPGIIINLN